MLKPIPQWAGYLGPCFHLLFLFRLCFLVSIIFVFQAFASVPCDFTEFERVEGSTIFFKAPGTQIIPPLKTKLFDLTYIGKLKSKAGGPSYFFFSGKSCQNCLEDRAIYAIKPNSQRLITYIYPGKILDNRKHSLLLESRAFFGNCLPRKENIYMVYQREKVDRRSALQTSVLIVEPTKDYLSEVFLERGLPAIKTTLNLVKKKKCQEISGHSRLMLSKPLDLNMQNEKDEDDDDIDNDN